jgi:hypothetical protein
VSQAFDIPLPPTTGPYLTEPPTTPSTTRLGSAAAPPPPVDELTALREKVAELDYVVGLAKTRVEALGAEKLAALERVSALEAELAAAEQREAELLARLAANEQRPANDADIVSELLRRVAALEAIVTPSRAA